MNGSDLKQSGTSALTWLIVPAHQSAWFSNVSAQCYQDVAKAQDISLAVWQSNRFFWG